MHAVEGWERRLVLRGVEARQAMCNLGGEVCLEEIAGTDPRSANSKLDLNRGSIVRRLPRPSPSAEKDWDVWVIMTMHGGKVGRFVAFGRKPCSQRTQALPLSQDHCAVLSNHSCINGGICMFDLGPRQHRKMSRSMNAHILVHP